MQFSHLNITNDITLIISAYTVPLINCISYQRITSVWYKLGCLGIRTMDKVLFPVVSLDLETACCGCVQGGCKSASLRACIA